MKFANLKRSSLVLTLTVAALGTAYAADAQAKFKLNHAARIGTGVLPAGEYMVTMAAEGTTKAFITPADRSGATVIVLPVTTDGYASCKQSSLTMQVAGPNWNVRSVCFADFHTALYFPVPAEKATATAANADTAVSTAAAK